MSRRLRFLPYPETLVEITNRTIHGRLLMQPTKRLRKIILGALGRAQRLYGVEIHALIFLSNHYHLLVSVRDVQQMASFVGYFQSKLAREIGRLTGWHDKIWARRYTAIPVSYEERAQVERLEYLLSQGVKEGLVPHPCEWPGAHSSDALLHGKVLEGVWYDRTAEFHAKARGERVRSDEFASREVVELSPLPCWRGVTPEVRTKHAETIVDRVTAGAEVDPKRLRRLLRNQRPTDRPKSSKRSPAPWFHCASRAIRIELRNAYELFLSSYRQAAAALRRGELTAPFPDGCFPCPRPFVAT